MPTPTAQSWQHHLHAVLLALACSLLFLRDAVLPGRALVPFPPELFDVRMAEAKAAGTFDAAEVLRGNAGMADKYLQSLCWDRVQHDRLRAGEVPRWTRDIGGGAPFVPQMAQPWEPINALLLLWPSEQWYGVWYLLHQVAFGWLAYAFFRRIGCLHASSLLGVVAAVLGLWTQCKVHHNVILTAALPLWPVLSAVHDLVHERARRNAAWSAGWLALWTGVSWSSGFVVVSLQVTYLALGFAALSLLRAPHGERLRPAAWIAGGLALGGMLSLANMLPVLMASAVSARAGTFDPGRLQSLGLEWDHALTACWPDLLSWGADRFWAPSNGDPLHFGLRIPWSQLVLLARPLRPEDHSAFQNWVETSFAIGLVPLATAAVALLDRSRRASVLFFAVGAFVSFGIATADQPFFGLARVLPGITAGDLRRLLFTTAMSLVALATLGADAQIRSGRRGAVAAVLGATALVSALAIGWLALNHADADFVRATAELIAADSRHPDVVAAGGDVDTIAAAMRRVAHADEPAHNRAMLLATAWRAFAVALLGIAALWLRPAVRAAVWIAVTAAELLHAGLGPVQTVAADRVTRVPAVLEPVAERVLPNGLRPRLQRLVLDGDALAALPGNLPGFLGLEDAAAYNPLPPARYEQFFTAIEPKRLDGPNVAFGGAGVGAFHVRDSLDHPLCDLYGIRFVLTREAIAATDTLVDRTPPRAGAFHLFERTTVLPRATIVDAIDLIPDADARLAALARRDRDVATRTVLEDPGAPAPTAGAAAKSSVAILEHRDERVTLRAVADGDCYVRLADPWDPGWCATVDGTPSPVYVADHYLRAVFVPRGMHTIVFTYDGPRVVWPARLSLVALLAAIAAIVHGRRRST